MPPLALTTQMLQCFLFAIYAHHLRMWTLFIPSAVGFILGFIWSTLYPCKVAPVGGLRLQWQMQYSISLLLVLLGSLTIRRMPHLTSTIATAAALLSFTYPLQSMREAYTQKNSSLMGSFAMNATMCLTCFVWVLHSSPFVEYDILVSNVAGVIVQGSALILRIVISRKKGNAQGEDAELTASTPLLREISSVL